MFTQFLNEIKLKFSNGVDDKKIRNLNPIQLFSEMGNDFLGLLRGKSRELKLMKALCYHKYF